MVRSRCRDFNFILSISRTDRSWSLNEYAFADPGTQALIRGALQEYLTFNNTPEVSSITLWATHKTGSRGQCIKLASNLKTTWQKERKI